MTDLFDQHPVVIAMLIVALSGVLAFIVSRAVASVVPWVNRLSMRLSSKPEPMLSREFSRLLQIIAFSGVLLAGIILVLSLFDNGELSELFDRSWGFVARLLFASGILVTGHILGALTRTLLRGFSRGSELAALPQIAYVAIAGIALLVALSHLGLDVSFITQLILVFFAVFFTGLALAFALGAKTLVANLAAGGELMNFKPGDRIRVDGIEGTVLEIHRTGAVLSTEEGLARIPARKFSELTVTILRKEEDDG